MANDLDIWEGLEVFGEIKETINDKNTGKKASTVLESEFHGQPAPSDEEIAEVLAGKVKVEVDAPKRNEVTKGVFRTRSQSGFMPGINAALNFFPEQKMDAARQTELRQIAAEATRSLPNPNANVGVE